MKLLVFIMYEQLCPGLEEEHMKTRLESCQDNAWWAVTAVVAGILLVLTSTKIYSCDS